MASTAQCELCDLVHPTSNLISNEPSCPHKARAPCLSSYVDGMNIFGMLSLGCWYNNCEQPLAWHVVALRDYRP
jgi:hypothetical protein